MTDSFLSIYLNDHLAAAVAGVELARRARGSNEGTELGTVLTGLCTEVEQDRQTLRDVMERLEVTPSKLKPHAAWAAEKLGRLKLNGQLHGYSPLSRVLELEGLCAGVAGKRQLWSALRKTFGSNLSGIDFDSLLARAESQYDRLEACRLEATGTAFGSRL